MNIESAIELANKQKSDADYYAATQVLAAEVSRLRNDLSISQSFYGVAIAQRNLYLHQLNELMNKSSIKSSEENG